MRIVVTGREGQVVRSLAERAALHPSVELLLLGRPELDLARQNARNSNSTIITRMQMWEISKQ